MLKILSGALVCAAVVFLYGVGTAYTSGNALTFFQEWPRASLIGGLSGLAFVLGAITGRKMIDLRKCLLAVTLAAIGFALSVWLYMVLGIPLEHSTFELALAIVPTVSIWIGFRFGCDCDFPFN